MIKNISLEEIYLKSSVRVIDILIFIVSLRLTCMAQPLNSSGKQFKI